MNIIGCADPFTIIIQEVLCVLVSGKFKNKTNPVFIERYHPDLMPGERIVHVACSAATSTAVFVTTKGRLWTCDNTYFYSSGGAEIRPADNPFVIISVLELQCDEYITHVACGDEQTILLTNQDRLFGSGSNQAGQLGLGSSQAPSQFVPIPLPNLPNDEQITHVACGQHHTVFSTSKGRLFGTGSNDRHQLGLKPVKTHAAFIVVPLPGLEPNEQITHVACGSGHTVFSTTKGRLWVAGCNQFGQLGLGSTETQDPFIPVIVPDLLPDELITHVACGDAHTIFSTNQGRLFGSGSNHAGPLGLGSTVSTHQFTPLPVPALAAAEQITDVVCGKFNTVIVTNEGRIFGTGMNNSYQLGLGHQQRQKQFVLASYLPRRPLVLPQPSLNCFASEYQRRIIHIHNSPDVGDNVAPPTTTHSSPDRTNIVNIHAITLNEFATLGLRSLEALSQKKQQHCLQLFCWLRLSMLNPNLASSLKNRLFLKPENYLITKECLSPAGNLINSLPNSAHYPVPIYHLPILPSGKCSVVLSLSPIIIVSAQDDRFDTRDVATPPRQLLDLPEELLEIILGFLAPAGQVNLMNTCKTARAMSVLERSLIKPLTISSKNYPHAEPFLTALSSSPNEMYSLETMAQIDALLQDIYAKTKNVRSYFFKNHLLAGRVSFLCLLDVHQNVCTTPNPVLPPFTVFDRNNVHG